MNAIMPVSFNTRNNVNFTQKFKMKYDSKTKEVLDEFYNDNPQIKSSDENIKRFRRCPTMYMTALNLVNASYIGAFMYTNDMNIIEHPVYAIAPIGFQVGILAYNASDKGILNRAANHLSARLANAGVSDAESYLALKELNENNRKLPFCNISDRKIRKIIAKNSKGASMDTEA